MASTSSMLVFLPVGLANRHYLHFATGFLVLALLLPAFSAMQASAHYHEYPEVVNLSDSNGSSSEPRIAIPYYDTAYVVWSDSSFGQTEILFKASRDGGKSFGSAINLSNSSGPSSSPEIAAWDKQLYVVWDDQTSGNLEVMFAPSKDYGATFASPINLSNSSADSVQAKVAMPEASDKVYVVWTEQNLSTDTNDVLLRVSNDSGSTFGNVINLSSNEHGLSSSYPQMAVSYGNEHVYVTWQTILDDGYAELFLRYSTDGGMSFNETVNLSNSKDQESEAQRMAISGDYLFIVWHEYNSTVSDVFFTRIAIESGHVDPPINLSHDPRNDSGASSPQIAANSGSNVFVMWHETTSSGNNRIILRTSLDAGYPFADKTVIDAFSGAPESSHLAVGDYYVSIVWQHGSDIYFRQQSPNDWRTYTQKINLSNNEGDSYSPQIAANGPKVITAWTDESFGNSSEIAFRDVTPFVYFEWPLYYGLRATTDSVSQIRNPIIGSNVTVTAVIDNNKERLDADAMFGLQVLDEKGIAEFVSISNITLLPENRSTLVSFTWTPVQDGWKTLQSFLWSADGYPLAEEIEDQKIAVGSARHYELSLEHQLEKTRVVSGEAVNGTLFLANNGDQSYLLTVDSINDNSSPLNPCNYFESTQLYEPIVLPPRDKVNLNSTITWMQWHPNTYNSTWYAVVSVMGIDDSKADCLQLASNTVALDVIPRPSPDGVGLVLSTDKQEYRGNETIHFTAYVDNNSGRPFDMKDFEFGVYFNDKTGKEVVNIIWVSPDTDYVVKPYSRKALSLYEAKWDQVYPDLEGRWIHIPAGEYDVHAEYWSPFLKSDAVTITINE